jgi:hypothetical protein
VRAARQKSGRMQSALATARVAAEQPTWSSEEEEEAPPRKARKAEKPEKIEQVPRLEAVSAAMLTSAVLKHEDLDRRVIVFPLNHSIRGASNADLRWAMESRNCTPTVHFNVLEDKHGYEPGVDELQGMAITAYEIADEIIEDERVAVVVTSSKGKDAPLFLAALAAKALGRLDKKAAKRALGGKRVKMPRDAVLKRLVTKFSGWSRVTAPHAIASNCV